MQIVYRYLFDEDMDLCTASARCLLASGGQAIRYWSLDLTPEEEKVFQRLYNWVKDSPQPLRTYATGTHHALDPRDCCPSLDADDVT